MTSRIQERNTVSPYLTFVIVHAMLFGIDFLLLTIKPVQMAGQDAWTAVLLCSAGIHIVIVMMYSFLNRHQTDLIHIHILLFGKWMGWMLNILFAGYFLLVTVYQLRLFIEVIQVWVFPEMKTWSLALVLLLIAFYIVSCGFRVIVGICMFSLLNTILFLTIFFMIPYFHFNNLLPAMSHSPHDIFGATKELTASYMGIEIIPFCYPFIKTPRKSQKWAHWGVLSMTFIYVVEVIFAVITFRPEQLSNELWPGLTKYKFIQFPFVERFEFIGSSVTVLRLFPIICLCIWVASRIMKFTFSIRQIRVLPVLLGVVFVATCFIPNRIGVDVVQSWIKLSGISVIFGYFPSLFLFDILRAKVKKTK
ncbi:spore germination protein (amino acid permease) [Paenibacillus taihuensis]|uniref:Spore germination protein (Amino acid permease) n=1 Tax=Paenibacillus taihuensis TaxID=1156355 RepID=A0A3D9SHD9_9BACL|nr:GerAB/ArcD/ProY family transporter [Paenibacillus taihuensis]REE91715.1 spore germination protein (amino acid permease) [Paenibacillus taihuensis]